MPPDPRDDTGSLTPASQAAVQASRPMLAMWRFQRKITFPAPLAGASAARRL